MALLPTTVWFGSWSGRRYIYIYIYVYIYVCVCKNSIRISTIIFIIDLALFPSTLSAHRHNFTSVSDRPGGIAKLTALVAKVRLALYIYRFEQYSTMCYILLSSIVFALNVSMITHTLSDARRWVLASRIFFMSAPGWRTM